MKKWTIEIKMAVSDTWVEDGFDASERVEDIQEAIAGLLPYAYGHEVKVKAKITSKPDTAAIRNLQGYDQ